MAYGRCQKIDDGPNRKKSKIGPHPVNYLDESFWYGHGSLDAAEAEVKQRRAAGEDMFAVQRNDPHAQHYGWPIVITHGTLSRSVLDRIYRDGEDHHLYQVLPFDKPRGIAFDIDADGVGPDFTVADGIAMLDQVVYPVITKVLSLCGVDWKHDPVQDGLAYNLGTKPTGDRKWSTHIHVRPNKWVLPDHAAVRRFRLLLKSVLLEYPEAAKVFDTGVPFATRQMFRLPFQSKPDGRPLQPADTSMRLDRFLVYDPDHECTSLHVPDLCVDLGVATPAEDAGRCPKRLTVDWYRRH